MMQGELMPVRGYLTASTLVLLKYKRGMYRVFQVFTARSNRPTRVAKTGYYDECCDFIEEIVRTI